MSGGNIIHVEVKNGKPGNYLDQHKQFFNFLSKNYGDIKTCLCHENVCNRTICCTSSESSEVLYIPLLYMSNEGHYQVCSDHLIIHHTFKDWWEKNGEILNKNIPNQRFDNLAKDLLFRSITVFGMHYNFL